MPAELREDNMGVIPYAGIESEERVTLGELESIVDALLDCADTVTPELERQLQIATEQAVGAVKAKRDAFAVFVMNTMIRIAGTRARREVLEQEIERLNIREQRIERILDRAREYVLNVIRAKGPDAKGRYPVLEGETCTLKANRCAPSVEVLDEAAIPVEFKSGTVQVPEGTWGMILGQIEDEDLLDLVLKQVRIHLHVDKRALLAALKQECPVCEGERFVIDDATETPVACPCRVCQETGKRHIPGAKLVADKLRLVID